MNSLPEMTNEELSKELHEALGGCIHDWKCIMERVYPDEKGLTGLRWQCSKCDGLYDEYGNYLKYEETILDYCNDLNAIATVEEKFDEKDALEYARAISHLITKEPPISSSLNLTAIDYLFATPRHRAEAALEVLKGK